MHCWGGVGRSSLFAAALLVARGTDADTALARIAAARGVPVPETDEQRAWVSGRSGAAASGPECRRPRDRADREGAEGRRRHRRPTGANRGSTVLVRGDGV